MRSAGLALGLMIMTLVGQCYGSLHSGYYRGKCGKYNVEDVVFNVVKSHYVKDVNTAPHLIRLQFHDCIVRGCDASILLDGKNTEKTASPNLSLGGFGVLDDAKVTLEKVCPGVVSCADILIIAARAAVYLAGGKWYDIETGRRDGRVSSQSEALATLPPINIEVRDAIKLFASRGLNKEDFIVLLGGHTLGSVHCNNLQNRLYNYKNTGKADPRVNGAFLQQLTKICPRNSGVNGATFLDQTPSSHFKVDNGYYKQILANKGLLEVDTNMAYSPLTQGIVRKLANSPTDFLDKFGPTMVKLARVGVLTGTQGEIRRSCRAVNH